MGTCSSVSNQIIKRKPLQHNQNQSQSDDQPEKLDQSEVITNKSLSKKIAMIPQELVQSKGHPNLALPETDSQLDYMNLPSGIARPISGTNQIIYFHLNSPNGLQIQKSIIQLDFQVPWFCASTQFGRFLYISGGTNAGTIYKHESQRTFYKLDLQQGGKLELMPGMVTQRSGHTIVAFTNSHIVALGGCRNQIKNTLSSCQELFHSYWDAQSIPPMNSPKVFLAATQFKAMDIFVFCGTKNGYQSGAVATIQHYRPKARKWFNLLIENKPNWDARVSLAAFNIFSLNMIIVFGGPEENPKAPYFLFDAKKMVLKTGKFSLRQKNIERFNVEENQFESLHESQGNRYRSQSVEDQNLTLDFTNKRSKKVNSDDQREYEQENEDLLATQVQNESSNQYNNSDQQSRIVLPRIQIIKRDVKSDQTYSDSFKFDHNRIGSVTPTQEPNDRRNSTIMQKSSINYSKSKLTISTGQKILKSPYLSHLKRNSVQFKNLQKSLKQKYKCSPQTTPRNSILYEQDQNRSHSAVLKPRSSSSNQRLRKINEQYLSTLDSGRSSSRVAHKKKKKKSKNHQKAYLSGVIGYNTPIVPVVELGLLLTINRRFDMPGQQQWELCWFDMQAMRWKIGGEWLANHLHVKYRDESNAEMQQLFMSTDNFINHELQEQEEDEGQKDKLSQIEDVIEENDSIQNEQNSLLPNYQNFEKELIEIPIGRSSFAEKKKISNRKEIIQREKQNLFEQSGYENDDDQVVIRRKSSNNLK